MVPDPWVLLGDFWTAYNFEKHFCKFVSCILLCVFD